MTLLTLRSKILAFPYWKTVRTELSKATKIDVQALARLKEPSLLDNDEFLQTPECLPTVRDFECQIELDYCSFIKRINGVPKNHVKPRKVRIYQPTKNAMQSGTDNIQNWEMQFDTQKRWENPNMGWCSTGDPLSNMILPFPTAEEAIDFCQKNGWSWYVDCKKDYKKMKIRPYDQIFSWDKRTRASTK